MTPEDYRIKTAEDNERWIRLLKFEAGEKVVKQLNAFGFAWISKSHRCHDILIKDFKESGWLITTGRFRSYISTKPILWFDRIITPLFAEGIL